VFYLVQILPSKKFETVLSEADFVRARELAEKHNFRTGLTVEIQDELGRPVHQVQGYRDE
jgi:hypothetical protein